jgi:dipeptidyl aminopeptidase/acylaminoacyl peptidase
VRLCRLAALLALVFLTDACSGAAPGRSRPGHVSRIVFARGETVWVADRDGRRRRPLTRGELPEISPDGHWVAFEAPQSPARRDCPTLACLSVIAADGGPVHLLARHVDEAVWSPDSRHLAADGLTSGPQYEDELATVDRVTGRRRPIAIAPSVLGYDFSPDGKQLAFAMSRSSDDRQSDIYVSATDGGDVRRLTWDGRSSWPVWAPDGSIFFSRRESRLGPFGGFKAWGEHRLWRIARDGTGRRVLTPRLKPAVSDVRLGLRAVAWSRNGRSLLAVSPTETGDFVYIVHSDGSLRSLGNHGYFGYATAVDISRDGRFVLLWKQLDGPDSRRTRVELVPTNGGAPRLIGRDVGLPSWNR